MFSQTVEYALRAVVYLSTNREQPQTNEAIAKATKMPAAYLAKVLRELSKAGIVKSQRGVGGGVLLNQSPDDLTIYQVVNAVEPIRRITTCPLGLSNHGLRLCALHSRLDQAMASVEDAFRQTTLGELLKEPNPSVPLCNQSSSPLITLKKRGR
jgi:Rrf2 family transcriptional regulator, nitric oxide-sensitive transcriptional repressor